MTDVVDVAVIGGGAAGLMGAIFAAGEGREVVVFETTADGGRKILISGGGRCNVLPSTLRPEQYVTASSRNTLKKILLSWPLAEQRRFFEAELGIPLVMEEETGKLFPQSNRARDVRDTLVHRARARGARIRFGERVRGLRREGAGTWRVETEAGWTAARRVIVATGGLSVPKTGSDGGGLKLVAELGHTVNPTYPALTPLTCTPPVHADLAGVSLRVRMEAPAPGGPYRAEGGFLFTHRGYSGPAVLDISHLAVRAEGPDRQEIRVSWGARPAEEWDEVLTGAGGGRVLAQLRRHLPARLAERLVEESGVDGDRPLSQLRREERRRLLVHLEAYPLPWNGDEGYRKAEVTGGGVALGEVDARTLESRIQPGLHLCGEILDVFGPIGGYNFAWAWATGRLAGQGAIQSREG